MLLLPVLPPSLSLLSCRAASPVSELSIFEVFSSDYWKKRAEVEEAPESATLGGAAALKARPALL